MCMFFSSPSFLHIHSSLEFMSVGRILHKYIPKSVVLCIYYFRELVRCRSPDESTTAAAVRVTLTWPIGSKYSLNFYCIIWNTNHTVSFFYKVLV
jgi:hypothetical protein